MKQQLGSVPRNRRIVEMAVVVQYASQIDWALNEKLKLGFVPYGHPIVTITQDKWNPVVITWPMVKYEPEQNAPLHKN